MVMDFIPRRAYDGQVASEVRTTRSRPGVGLLKKLGVQLESGTFVCEDTSH